MKIKIPAHFLEQVFLCAIKAILYHFNYKI